MRTFFSCRKHRRVCVPVLLCRKQAWFRSHVLYAPFSCTYTYLLRVQNTFPEHPRTVLEKHILFSCTGTRTSTLFVDTRCTVTRLRVHSTYYMYLFRVHRQARNIPRAMLVRPQLILHPRPSSPSPATGPPTARHITNITITTSETPPEAPSRVVPPARRGNSGGCRRQRGFRSILARRPVGAGALRPCPKLVGSRRGTGPGRATCDGS